MSESSEQFSLAHTLQIVWQAFYSVVCTIGFNAAIHGFMIALVVLIVALGLGKKSRYSKPLKIVFKKIALFYCVLGLPGSISLIARGSLPTINALQLSSFGLLGFWSLVTLHLCMEELNFQWFKDKDIENGVADTGGISVDNKLL